MTSLDLLDLVAMAALAALITKPDSEVIASERLACEAYTLASAMMAERRKRGLDAARFD